MTTDTSNKPEITERDLWALDQALESLRRRLHFEGFDFLKGDEALEAVKQLRAKLEVLLSSR